MTALKGSKYSISLDAESELLKQHMIATDEGMSAFVQRMIKAEAKRRKLKVEISVVQGR